MQTKTTKNQTQQTTQTTQNPQTQHTQQTQKKVITIGARGRSPKSKEKDKIAIELRKLIENYVFEIPDATSCKPIQAYVSSYSANRVQGLITLLCSSVGYNILTNVAFVAKRNENEYEIEKTWIKNAIRLFVTMEPKEEDIKIVFADELK